MTNLSSRKEYQWNGEFDEYCEFGEDGNFDSSEWAEEKGTSEVADSTKLAKMAKLIIYFAKGRDSGVIDSAAEKV